MKKKTYYLDSDIQIYSEFRLIQIYSDFKQKNKRHLTVSLKKNAMILISFLILRILAMIQ